MVMYEIKRIVKNNWKQLLWVSFLIGFLLFLLNVFLAGSFYASQFSDSIKEKLWLYFYIKNTDENKDLVYKQVIQLKDELQGQWLQVMFSSQEDAFQFLEKKFPDIIDNFKKFWINNPLPSTLYVMFKNEAQYNMLRNTIIKYKDIILNIKDIDQENTIKQQENRVLRLINFSNFIQGTLYVLILILSVIILTFLVFLLNNLFQRFSKELIVKKLLGALYTQLTASFIGTTTLVMLVGFVLSYVMILIATAVMSIYVSGLLDVNMWTYIGQNIGSILFILLIELLIILSLSISISYRFLRSVHQKI